MSEPSGSSTASVWKRPPHGGREVAATGCVLDLQEARYAGPPLRGLADLLGTRLFPVGRTEADAPMAVDEEGRLFSLGPGGAWLLGETVRDGLLALTEGLRPVRLRGREWQWPRTPASPPSTPGRRPPRPESEGGPLRAARTSGPVQRHGSAPARRAATTASMRVCAPSFRIAERR
ncbi:SUKH-3 domain-containing protein [Streptomyces exfoliatus]|uniref:SUKH-3 domain-containing protein n=1 Tax=Streptomyces exfoliatus TaxID=1905 RepID=A0ABV3D2F8_STREX